MKVEIKKEMIKTKKLPIFRRIYLFSGNWEFPLSLQLNPVCIESALFFLEIYKSKYRMNKLTITMSREKYIHMLTYDKNILTKFLNIKHLIINYQTEGRQFTDNQTILQLLADSAREESNKSHATNYNPNTSPAPNCGQKI